MSGVGLSDSTEIIVVNKDSTLLHGSVLTMRALLVKVPTVIILKAVLKSFKSIFAFFSVKDSVLVLVKNF